MEDMGIKMKSPKEITIEREFERLEKMDIDNWENKRGPRPWEEQSRGWTETKLFWSTYVGTCN